MLYGKFTLLQVNGTKLKNNLAIWSHWLDYASPIDSQSFLVYLCASIEMGNVKFNGVY